MDYDRTNIAIIGRGVNQDKWNTIYEILDENSEDVSYEKFDISNNMWHKKVSEGDFHAYIYLATMPKYTNLPYIKLTAAANDDDIMAGMEELVSKLTGDNEEVPQQIEEVTSETIEEPEHKASSELFELLNNPIVCDVLDDFDPMGSTWNGNGLSKLQGVSIKINDKEVTIDKDDAFKLKELMAFAKEFGYEITDIIVD